jgi:hypothetical protein
MREDEAGAGVGNFARGGEEFWFRGSGESGEEQSER